MSDINEEAVIAKIRKLFALSESSNAEEASSAMNKAHELLEKYNLDVAKVTEVSSDIIIEAAYEGKRARGWLINLASAITYANYCSSYTSSSRRWGEDSYQRRSSYYTLNIVGKAVNVATCKVMLDYLLKTIKRLSDNQKGAGRLAIESYKIGLVTVLCSRLHEIRRNSEMGTSECRDLVVVNDAAAKAKVNEICGNNFKKTNMSAADLTGYLMGTIDGQNISLNTQVSGKPEGSKEAIGYAG
jgi:hypothetical protein